jgi:hypothetical protein
VPPTNRSIESVCLASELCDDLVPDKDGLQDLQSPELRDEDLQKKNNRRPRN